MARARNIKPGFFSNELLADLQPFDRLLFIGLWCLADREGRLEDRAKRIKMELFPCDTYDVEQGLNGLALAGFISRYCIEGQSVIEIDNFQKHQRPHGTEKDSVIPDKDGYLTVNQRKSNGVVTGESRKINVKEALNNVKETLSNVNPPLDNALIPDSPNPDSLIPDSKDLITDGDQLAVAEDLFPKFWKLYPNKKGKANAEKAWKKLKVTDELFTLIASGLAKQVVCAEWTKDGGQFIPHPATWLNGKRWEDEVKPASNVHQFPPSRHNGFADRDYTAGLTQREDGTYAL